MKLATVVALCGSALLFAACGRGPAETAIGLPWPPQDAAPRSAADDLQTIGWDCRLELIDGIPVMLYSSNLPTSWYVAVYNGVDWGEPRRWQFLASTQPATWSSSGRRAARWWPSPQTTVR
jgi:hypothetical protein